MKKRVFIYAVVFFASIGCLRANNGTGSVVSDKNPNYSFHNLNAGEILNGKKNSKHKTKTLFATAPGDFFRSVTSGAWNLAATWESSPDSISWEPATLVPGPLAAHVVIHSPDSVHLTGNQTTANLTIMSGARMNALIFTLNITSRFKLLGTAFFYQGGTIRPVPGIEQILEPASTYVYNGTQVGLNAAYPEFGNLVFKPSPGSDGTFENTNAAAPFFNGLVVRGYMTINLQQTRGINFATGSTVSRIHTIDGNLNIIDGFSIVSVQKGAAGSATSGTVNIGGNLNFSGGTLLGLGYDPLNSGMAVVNLTGNINNTLGQINTGTSTVGVYDLNFVGTSAQQFNSNGTIITTDRQNITINNSAGVRFNTPVVQEGNLIFVTGILRTTFLNLLTLGTASTVSGVSNTGFVDGPVKKKGSSAFTFPVGKTGFGYVPIGISTFFGGTATDEFTAEYMRGSARLLGPLGAGPGLKRVSDCDYWTLEKNTATPISADITAYWSSNNICQGGYVTNPNTLTIAHFDGSFWDSYALTPIVTGGSTGPAGSLTWPGATDFSPFSLGSITFGDNPLPITINYFKGTRQNNNHLLNWKLTCNSTPGANIEIERSSDGVNFKTIYSLYATAVRCLQPFDFTDNQPAKGINYYRIKMTDADGFVTYSSTISLINAAKGIEIMNIAPNPVVNGTFNLKLSTAEKMMVELLVTDMQGRVLQKQTVSAIAGFNSIPVNVRNLARGTYQLFGNTSDGRTRVLRFVVQ